MKDNIIRIEDDSIHYVADELIYKNKKYIYCFEVDSNDELIKENINIMEVTVKNDKLIIKEIEDLETVSTITNLFLARNIQE